MKVNRVFRDQPRKPNGGVSRISCSAVVFGLEWHWHGDREIDNRKEEKPQERVATCS